MATQKSLSLFRIALYGVILAELVELAMKAEYAFFNAYSFRYLLPLAIFFCVFALLGAFTRLSAIGLWVAVKYLHADLYAWYEVDWVVALMSLLFCFAPASKAWSIDAVRAKFPKKAQEEEISGYFVFAVITVMTMLYFDSLLIKYASVSWTGGASVWLANFVPHVARFELPEWMQVSFALKAATYATIVYESLFFLILFRRTRTAVLVAGLGLHLGISIFLPLTYFGLIMAAPLLLFLDLGKGTAPVRTRTSRALEIATAVYILALVGAYAHMKFSGNARSPFVQLLGVHPTGVYSDGKFLIQAPIVRLEVSTKDGMIRLPSFTDEGYPEIRDRDWKVFGFFLRMRACNMGDLIRYVKRYDKKCDLMSCRIDVLVKDAMMYSFEIDPKAIEDFKKRPWTKIGQLEWSPVLGGVDKMQWRDESNPQIKSFRERFLTICN